LLTATAAFAQSNTGIQADIPFAFHMGTTILPAGHYEVTPYNVRNVLLLRCRGCGASALILMNHADPGKTAELGTLMFNRYDKTYFLSRVWIPEYSQEKVLRRSKAELEYARSGSTVPPAVVAFVRP
jgi:hypothetical protein